MTAFSLSRVALVCAALLAGCAQAADTCGDDPDPVALARQLTRAYERALRALSADSARALRQGQQDWRLSTDRECAAANRHVSPGKAPQDECLENAMGKRIAQLGDVGLRAGALVLTRVDRAASEAAPRSSPPGTDMQPALTHRAYPQIDVATSPDHVAWNLAQARAPVAASSSEYGSDIDRDYAVGCASQHVIGLLFTTYDFPHGAAHGTTRQEARNFLLDPTLRAMTPDDLFAPGSPWPTRLPDLVWQAYLDDGGQFARDPSFEANVRAVATQPGHWLLTPEGLQINFSSYEAGCYACGPGPLTVPWSALEPLLAAAAPRPVCEAPSNAGN